MAHEQVNTATTSAEFGARPRDDQLDLFGITHTGRVRVENQDHFLVATVHPELVVHETSLPPAQSMPIHGTRLATVMLVADGVGGSTGGREASQLAIETMVKFVSSTLRCYHAAGSSQEDEFVNALRSAALEAHTAVRAESALRPDASRMATTLTLFIAVMAVGVRGAGWRQPLLPLPQRDAQADDAGPDDRTGSR